jgi:predicted small metal-binding protein
MGAVNTGNKATQKVSFACSDMGQTCDWQVSGDSEDEVMQRIEQHGREAHDLDLDDNIKEQVRKALRTIPSF